MSVRNPCMQTEDPNENLFLFGYSCKLFCEDEKARYIAEGKHLIPWMGDESVMIDRYDVRAYLQDIKPYEAHSDLQFEDPDSEDEKLCDEERYRSLRSDLSEEELYQEEELKRLRAAVACDGAYHEIGFSYDNEVDNFNNEPEGPKEEPEELYEPPTELNIPKGMEVPYNMKIHAIIEKTALFVSEQGVQMEIIIKVKQKNNLQFGFMHLDNPLYPYYKFLLDEIKCGSYKPVHHQRVSCSEDEDDDDDDGHYLHPSLLAGKKENVPQFTVPSINFRRSQDDSYSVLVRNLQQQIAEEKLSRESPKENGSVPEAQQHLVNYSLNESQVNNSANNSYTTPEIPPPNIQPIIQKMVEYVAKNGEDFEFVVKSKNDTRLEFLQPSSQYYCYYIHLRDQSKLQLQPLPVSAAVTATESSTSNDSAVPPQNLDQQAAVQPLMDKFDEVSKAKCSKAVKGPVSFSVKAKDADAVQTEKLKMRLLLNDSEEESNDEMPKGEKGECNKRKSPEESKSPPNSRHDSVERGKKPKLTSEMEAKLAEERMKDKSLSSARERIVQQKKEKRLEMEQQKREEQLRKEKQLQIEQQCKEKQLQLERKKKTALFLEMLKSRNSGLDTLPELQTEQQCKEKQLQLECKKKALLFREMLKSRNSGLDALPQLLIEQQCKEKQLQLERKKKAALFREMLKSGNSKLDTLPNRLGSDEKTKSDKSNREFWNIGDASGSITSENDILFPRPEIRSMPVGVPGTQSEWSESSASAESGEEIMIAKFCSDPVPRALPVLAPVIPKTLEPKHRHEHKKKRKRHSRSRSRERRYKSSRTQDRCRSRSPRNCKQERSKKEKKLPAAYAVVNRSRSRFRSPRRYRQNPSYLNMRR